MMTGYVLGVDGVAEMSPTLNLSEKTFHIWTHGKTEPWPCVGDGRYREDRAPAACGEEGMAAWVVAVDEHFDSLRAMLRHGNICKGCERAVRLRHGMKMNRDERPATPEEHND